MEDQKPISFDFSDIPEPPKVEEEGALKKGLRIMTDPLTTTLGMKPLMDKLAQGNDSVIGAQLRGLLSGSLEGLSKPTTLAQIAALPAMAAESGAGLLTKAIPYTGKIPGMAKLANFASRVYKPVQAGALVGNTAMAGEGAMNTVNDINDPNASKAKVAMDIVNTGLGALGAFSGFRGLRAASKAAAAARPINTPKATLDTQLEALRKDSLENGFKTVEDGFSHPDLDAAFKAKYPELFHEVSTKPSGYYARHVYSTGEEGLRVRDYKPEQAPLQVAQARLAKQAIAKAKAEQALNKLMADELQLQDEANGLGVPAAPDPKAAQIKALNAGFKDNADANKGLIEAQKLRDKVIGKAQDEAPIMDTKVTAAKQKAEQVRLSQAQYDRIREKLTVAKDPTSLRTTVKGIDPETGLPASGSIRNISEEQAAQEAADAAEGATRRSPTPEMPPGPQRDLIAGRVFTKNEAETISKFSGGTVKQVGPRRHIIVFSDEGPLPGNEGPSVAPDLGPMPKGPFRGNPMEAPSVPENTAPNSNTFGDLTPDEIKRYIDIRPGQGSKRTPTELAEYKALHARAISTPTATTPVTSTSEVKLSTKDQLALAAEEYDRLKIAKAAGEKVDPAALKEAGRNAQQLHKALVEEIIANPDSIGDAAKFGENLSDKTKAKLLADIQKRFKSQGKPNDAGFAAAELPMRILGAGVGSYAGHEEDPLGNPTASGIGGGLAGFFAPEILNKGNQIVPQIGEALIKARGGIKDAAKYANQVHNMGLLSPLSVAKKAAGDIGGLALASAENPGVGGRVLKQLLTREGRAAIGNSFREGWNGPEQESIGGLDLSGKLNSNKNPFSWSGKTMGGLTTATKDILGEAGLNAQDQRYYTLTDYPHYDATQKFYNAIRTNPFSKHLIPFARVGVNRLERGYEYSPLGLANLLMEKHSVNPGKQVAKALLGTGAMYSAYKAAPEDLVKEHPIAASVASSLAGPMGLPVLASMALKNSHKEKGDKFYSVPSGGKLVDATSEIARDVPGLRLIEDAAGRDPEGFVRNYLSGYTNSMRPIAMAQDKFNGDTEEPDVSSKDLTTGQRLTNRMLSNIPGVRQTLPKKTIKLTAKPKIKWDF